MSRGLVGRIVELAFALVCLPLILPPMLLGALLLKLQGKGSILYAGKRVGKDGRVFTLYKFRTLLEGTEQKVGATLLPDESSSSLATPVGKWLRRLKIDEMPQIVNILKGEMSYIGPRPNRPEYYAKHLAEIPGYSDRVKVKPGITGLAQIYGNYYTSPRNKLRYDRLYIRNQGIALDFKLIALNFLVFFPSRRRWALMKVSNKPLPRALEILWRMWFPGRPAPRLGAVREALAPTLLRLGIPHLVRSAPAEHVRVLLYHYIPQADRAAFEAQVDHIARRYRVLTPEEFAATAEGRRRPGVREVLFTFDDGTASDAWVAEVLERRGLRGVFFVTPRFVQEGAPALLAAARSYRRVAREVAALDWPAVRRLAESGHAVGSHTASHRRLSGLSGKGLQAEVDAAADTLQEQLGRPVEWLAFPYGRATDVDRLGMRAALNRHTLVFSGVRGGWTGGRVVPRESLDPRWSPALVDLCLEGGLDPFHLRARRTLTHLERLA